MVHGANKSGSRKKKFVRTPTGTVTRFVEKRSGKPTCVSGRPLAGTARGNKSQVRKLSKTQRRPSRPFGGVLSAPLTKLVFKDQAAATELAGEATQTTSVYVPGRVCMKIAGRDAGKICVILEETDGKVLIDGQTRRRTVSTTHLEPLNRMVKVTKTSKTEDVKKALTDLGVTISEPKQKPAKAKKE